MYCSLFEQVEFFASVFNSAKQHFSIASYVNASSVRKQCSDWGGQVYAAKIKDTLFNTFLVELVKQVKNIY